MRDKYDVFISYSHNDQEWVRTWLLPRLDDCGLTVCVDFRDFDIGSPSVTNIERAVERSSHTLLVMTEHWVASEWTELESQLTSLADPAARRRKLLPLLLKHCQVPPRLKALTWADFRNPKNWNAEFDRLSRTLSPSKPAAAGFTGPEIQPHQSAGPSVSIQLEESMAAALRRLLALQYPWGEWSDRRTTLESEIAERSARRGVEGPKPNLARTLFALEALEPFRKQVIQQRFDSAMRWIETGIDGGWYSEWIVGQTPDSEIDLPNLRRRPDIRHTAQAIVALVRWDGRRDRLADLTTSIAANALDNGFWAETPGDPQPMLLATIYSLEALGAITLGLENSSFADVFDRRATTMIWSAYRRGLAALHREADLGEGLLGHSFGGQTPYLTGLALYRLAPLAEQYTDIYSLTRKLIAGLSRSILPNGWTDTSVSPPLRDETLKRTTLRAAAGLARARNHTGQVAPGIWHNALSFTVNVVSSPAGLDSPDYACAVEVLCSENPSVIGAVRVASLEQQARVVAQEYFPRWCQVYRDYVARLAEGVQYDLQGYRELAAELDRKLSLLERIPDQGHAFS